MSALTALVSLEADPAFNVALTDLRILESEAITAWLLEHDPKPEAVPGLRRTRAHLRLVRDASRPS